jgi:DNA-binding NtrC family response regulator
MADFASISAVVLRDVCLRTGRAPRRVSPEGLRKLQAHSWPGNLRELSNVLERALILSAEDVLGPDVLDLPGLRPQGAARLLAVEPQETETTIRPLAEVERAHIEKTLKATHGRIYGAGGAAELLGLKPSTLQSRMKKLGIERSAPTALDTPSPGSSGRLREPS